MPISLLLPQAQKPAGHLGQGRVGAGDVAAEVQGLEAHVRGAVGDEPVVGGLAVGEGHLVVAGAVIETRRGLGHPTVGVVLVMALRIDDPVGHPETTNFFQLWITRW